MLTVIKQIELWQQHMLYAHDTRFVYASDEWYLKAGVPLPQDSDYEGYFQLDNGVGMVRLLQTEVCEYLETLPDNGNYQRNISLATGTLVAEELKKIICMITDRYPGISATVYPINNVFFGEEITVVGLITGQDLIHQLSDKALGH